MPRRQGKASYVCITASIRHAPIPTRHNFGNRVGRGSQVVHENLRYDVTIASILAEALCQHHLCMRRSYAQ